MKKLLVTGSGVLIGSEICVNLAAEGWEIIGIYYN
jgi:NAD(P)-dependent dehydrogenase (short-subunit alcohol dehydrogenase family)